MTDVGPGLVLADRYRIELSLESRGLNELHRGTDLEIGDSIAILTLAPQWRSDVATARRVVQDLERARSLGHPNLVPVRAAGALNDGGTFCVMPWLEMTNLGRLLLGGRLPPRDVATLILPAAAALDALHESGVVHRAISPARIAIRLASQPTVLLSGFGFGPVLAPEGDAHERPTSTVVAPHQLDYLAPEADRGSQADGRVDVYALAAVAYRAITGAPPFDPEPSLVRALVVRQTQAPPFLADRLREPVDPGLEAVVRRGLAGRPEDRFEGAGAFARALFETTHPEVAEPVPAPPAEIADILERAGVTREPDVAFERPTAPRAAAARRALSSPSLTMEAVSVSSAERVPSVPPSSD